MNGIAIADDGTPIDLESDASTITVSGGTTTIAVTKQSIKTGNTRTFTQTIATSGGVTTTSVFVGG